MALKLVQLTVGLTFAIFPGLTSCKNTWNENEQENWKSACMEDATKWAGSADRAKTYCDCVLPEIIKKYPIEKEALEHVSEFAADSLMKQCKNAGLK